MNGIISVFREADFVIVASGNQIMGSIVRNAMYSAVQIDALTKSYRFNVVNMRGHVSFSLPDSAVSIEILDRVLYAIDHMGEGR